jgi:ABC-type multidrug transport system fused ATPase/permease subunit
LEDVLKRVSFTVKAGEKIGIVGRTGSGKSSLLLCLLRVLEASHGRIEIDGNDISQLSLTDLRSNMSVILQEHFLFAGTVRENVDPTQEHPDSSIRQALQECGLW